MEAMRAKAQAMKSKAAEAGKAKQAKQSAMAEQAKPYTDTLKNAIQAKKAAPAGGMKAALDKAIANRPAAKPAMPARPMGGGMGTRAGMTRPARPMGGMGMKKGGKAGKK
jgi:hypothetical protein